MPFRNRTSVLVSAAHCLTDGPSRQFEQTAHFGCRQSVPRFLSTYCNKP